LLGRADAALDAIETAVKRGFFPYPFLERHARFHNVDPNSRPHRFGYRANPSDDANVPACAPTSVAEEENHVIVLSALVSVFVTTLPRSPSSWEPRSAEDARDTLSLRHAVRNDSLVLELDDLTAIQVAAPFRYVSGQRFILRNVADAEQHVFVVADSSRRIQRFVWIQIESFLPGVAGAYDYGADSLVSHGGRALRVQTRTYSTPPDPSSDRGALYALLSRLGYVTPPNAVRTRWIQLGPDGRSEIMVIHVESLNGAAEDPARIDAGAAIDRARRAFRLLPELATGRR
jgi:hypothetical protein